MCMPLIAKAPGLAGVLQHGAGNKQSSGASRKLLATPGKVAFPLQFSSYIWKLESSACVEAHMSLAAWQS